MLYKFKCLRQQSYEVVLDTFTTNSQINIGKVD